MEKNTSKNSTNLYHTKREQFVLFFFVATGVISVTYGALSLMDFLPEKQAIAPVSEKVIEETPVDVQVEVAALPVSIIFDTLGGKEVTVLNPDSVAIADLDTALLSGVVRYPDSADFEKTGTIFLLGHSSYLPVVHNKNFQAFNGIQKLVWGDTIRLRSADTEYVYSVERVYETKATDALIDIEWGTAKLVLATCNSFASKDDRYVVEAVLVGSHKINENKA